MAYFSQCRYCQSASVLSRHASAARLLLHGFCCLGHVNSNVRATKWSLCTAYSKVHSATQKGCLLFHVMQAKEVVKENGLQDVVTILHQRIEASSILLPALNARPSTAGS